MQISLAALPRIQQLVSSLRKRVSNLIEEKSSVNKIDQLHSNGLNEKCGIFAYFSKNGNKYVGEILSKSMQRLVHRGDKAAGCAYFRDGDDRTPAPLYRESDPEHPDPVNELLDSDKVSIMYGSQAIGHTLYATSRTKNQKTHVQPIRIDFNDGTTMYLAHNGNLPDCKKLKSKLKSKGVDTKDCNDSKLIAKAIAYYIQNKGLSLENAIKTVLNKPWFPQGAYSLLIMVRNKIIAVRDRFGNKPFVLGRTGGGIALASESAAFKPIDAELIRDIRPGEMLVIDRNTNPDDLAKEPESYSKNGPIPKSSIIFPETSDKLNAIEDIYFLRPDSIRSGKSVHKRRMDLGKQLAKTFKNIHPQLLKRGNNKIDYVVPIPESGRAAAEAFASELKLPFTSALIKNKHQRTFISERGVVKNDREEKIREKFSIIDDVVKDKNILLVDDSLVRSNTIKVLEEMFKKAGAKSVHFAIPAPPVLYPNFYGIDTATQEELFAAKYKSDTDLAKALKLDSITYLTVEEFKAALGVDSDTSDFDGSYPIPIGKKAKDIKQVDFQLQQAV